MTSKTLFRMTALAAVAIMIGAAVAEARPRGSFGSRGSRSYSPPPVTNTAPNVAQPMQRTTTPAPAPGVNQPGMAQRPGMPTQPARQGSRWGGLGMGLAAGFLGAGLFGLLAGNGFLGGLASFAGFLGFLFQIALIGGLVWLVLRFVRGRREASAGPVPAHARMGGAGSGLGGGPLGDSGPAAGPLAGMAGGSVAGRTAPSDTVGVTGADFDMFERRLTEVLEAYGREDVNALRALATPEMVSYFVEDLKANEARGVANRISDVKLLQGDLSEAWREADADYATVAMRYGLVDVTVDRASGRIAEGNPRGEEAVELWTFRRPHGGAWQLSAIQQT